MISERVGHTAAEKGDLGIFPDFDFSEVYSCQKIIPGIGHFYRNAFTYNRARNFQNSELTQDRREFWKFRALKVVNPNCLANRPTKPEMFQVYA